jgi:toxin ParE1/3/4
MTPQFRLTQPAIQDIEQIADYLANRSGLTQAEKFLAKLATNLSRDSNASEEFRGQKPGVRGR